MDSNKYKNHLFKCFLIFYIFCLFCSPISYALGLEIDYPTIGKATALNQSSQLPDYIKYIYEAGIYLGFGIVIISFAWAGLLWVLSNINGSFLSEAKERIMDSISGLLLLLCSYLIITTINPNLSILSLNKIQEQDTPTAEIKEPGGVYLNDDERPHTKSLLDLGPLKNKIQSVRIVDNGGSYMSVFYDNINLWGKCQYVNYSAGTVPWAASMSVHTYDFESNGDGVYFFRKACFNKIENSYNNKSGLINNCKQKGDGYFKVSNGDIGDADSFYVGKLSDLEFEDVPEEEKECIKYDENHKCTERETPTLAGRNISSVVINGNYLVLFVYFSPDDSESGPWTFCQEFPISGDTNKLGAYQIKWDAIMNASGTGSDKDEIQGSFLPNYVIIVPIN